MFIQNKKFVIGLSLLTILAFFFSNKPGKTTATMSEKEIVNFSTDFNKNLPMVITPELSLIKTQIGTINNSLYSLDFFYSYYKNKNDIKDFTQFTSNMIFQTCSNEITLALLNRNLLLRHQFITLDKEKLPYIGVSLKDCQQIMKEQK